LGIRWAGSWWRRSRRAAASATARISSTSSAAASGRGVALAKRTLAQADLASGRLVAPFPDGSEAVGFAYSVVQPRDRPPSPSATAFVAWLKRQAVDHDNTMGQL
jgi:LysR family glycine cleavage system transcriptional activator